MDFTNSNSTQSNLDTFPLLADPASYVACPWDLTTDSERRVYWLGVFRKHLVSLLEFIVSEAADRGVDATAQRDEVGRRFNEYLDTVERDPGAFGRLDVLSICWQREIALRSAGVADPYRVLKRQENERALALLPALLDELDQADDAERDRLVIEGVFAGNIFDMGAEHTQKLFEGGSPDFGLIRRRLKPRPWRYDALEAWTTRLNAKPYRAAVLFVDNAGPDVVLGMIPLARDLLRRGTAVVLSANSEPSLNDVTHAELVGLIQRVGGFDETVRKALENKQLRLVESGNWAPLMDLTKISPRLVEVCNVLPIDLVVLEGMGRSMESNPDCRLTCDVLRLAMVKDLGVAQSFDADLFDLVMRYEQVEP